MLVSLLILFLAIYSINNLKLKDYEEQEIS